MKTPKSATDIKVGGKTPEEIKKGLEYCYNSKPCADCQYDKRDFPHCVHRLIGDALAGYQQLESRLAQAERERDALWYDMHQLQGATCAYCENLHRPDGAVTVACKVFGDLSKFCKDENYNPLMCGKFKWRGVCPENTKEETDD